VVKSLRIGILAVAALVVAFAAMVLGAAFASSASAAPLVAPRVAVSPPIDSGAEAHAAVLALGTPFNSFAPIESAMIGANATYEVKGSDGGDAAWIVIYTYGWGDCQAGCIDRHSWAFQVDSRTGIATYDSQMGSALVADAPAALRAIDDGAGGRIPDAWLVAAPSAAPSESVDPGASIDPTDYEALYAKLLEDFKATLSPCAGGMDTSDPMMDPCLRADGSVVGRMPLFAPAPGPHDGGGHDGDGEDGWITNLPVIIFSLLIIWGLGALFVGWRRSRS
jgi:hypothetical protein